MGSSGSGKTSLLNALCGRLVETNNASLKGKILINGVNVQDEGANYNHMVGYVRQEDFLFNLQSVHETLLTASHFSLPNELTTLEKQQRVEKLLDEMGLSDTKDTYKMHIFSQKFSNL